MITENEVCTAGLKNYFIDSEYYNQPPDPQMVDLCRKFIKEWLTSSPNYKHKNSSYHLKHEVERWANRYISNGSFVLAAVLEGLEQKPTGINSPNTWVSVKKKYNPYHNQPRIQPEVLHDN